MIMSKTTLRLSSLLILCHHVIGQTCHPCGDAKYEMTTPSRRFNAGIEHLSCQDLVSIAGDRRQGTDVCYLVNNYALEHCNCRDEHNNPAPDLPYYDSTEPCNICGGSRRGSDLWTVNPALSERNVPTSLGISVKCGFLFTTGLQGAFLPSQCPDVQDATREACGCGFYDASGNPVSGAILRKVRVGALVLLEALIACLVW